MKKNQSVKDQNLFFKKNSDISEPQEIIVQTYMQNLDKQDPQTELTSSYIKRSNQNSSKQRKESLNYKQNVENTLLNPFKIMVSKNKKRFEWEGYDLDLSYINDKIIAMGFPSQNIESIYRNKMQDVQSFLEKRHSNHYKVYNLCKQRTYLKTHFKGNVAEYGFQDHLPPPFQMIYYFCRDTKDWLDRHKENIAVIHCKAGKGRTGTMISCLLMYLGITNNAQDSMHYYASKRTVDGKGVTIPSQIRYIKYYEYVWKNNITLQKYYNMDKKVRINWIKVSPIPQIHFLGGCTPWISICNKHNTYKSKYSHQLITYKQEESFQLAIDQKFYIKGDMIISFFSKRKIGGSEQYMHICLNSNFVDKTVIISGNQIDGVKNDPRYNKNTVVQIHFLFDDLKQ